MFFFFKIKTFFSPEQMQMGFQSFFLKTGTKGERWLCVCALTQLSAPPGVSVRG